MIIKQTITTLELASNQITSQGVESIANALQDNKTLTTLNLSWNKLDDKGIQSLSTILQTNTVRLVLTFSNLYNLCL